MKTSGVVCIVVLEFKVILNIFQISEYQVLCPVICESGVHEIDSSASHYHNLRANDGIIIPDEDEGRQGQRMRKIQIEWNETNNSTI